MAENRIIDYSKDEDTVEWFYHDHNDGKKYTVKEDAPSFIEKLFLHIPDNNFRTVRYYGLYSNKAGAELNQIHTLLGDKKKQDYSREVRKKNSCVTS